MQMRPKLLQTFRFGKPINSAAISYQSMSDSYSAFKHQFLLTLCFGNAVTTFSIYGTASGSFAHQLVSHYRSMSVSGIESFRPVLSSSGHAACWFDIHIRQLDQGQSLCISALARDTTATSTSPTLIAPYREDNEIYEIKHGDSDGKPALYHMAIMDYDDGRGLAAVGNGFGELGVYDFSNLLPTEIESLESCFHVQIPEYNGEELLPQVSIFWLLIV